MAEDSISLAELIRREQDNTGASYMDIARRTGLSKAKIGQLADPRSRYQVRSDTIEKLATGLGLPVRVVKRAALVTAGIGGGDDGDGKDSRIELISSRLALLDDAMLDTVAAMVDAAVRARAKE